MVVLMEQAKNRKAEAAKYPIGDLSWTNVSDLEAANSTIPTTLQVLQQQKYSTLDVDKTFKKLIDCGDLLRIALAKAGTQPCSVPVTKVIDKYQDLCNNSTVASSSFVNACVEALRSHKLMFKAIEKGKADLAIKQFGKCGELATTMATVAASVEEQAEALAKLASESLLAAKNDHNVSDAQRRKIEEDLAKLNAAKSRMDSKVASLSTIISETREAEEKYASEARAQRDKAQTMAIVKMAVGAATSMLAGPIGAVGAAAAGCFNGPQHGDGGSGTGDSSGKKDEIMAADKAATEGKANLEGMKTQIKDLSAIPVAERTKEQSDKLAKLQSELSSQEELVKRLSDDAGAALRAMTSRAESLEAKEAAATARRHALEDEMREENADLAKTIAEMSTMKTDKSQAEQTVLCLMACVKILGKIVTTFKNVKLFWQCVAQHCTQLAAMNQQCVGAIADWNILEEDEKELEQDDVLDLLRESTVSWAALGKVNIEAHKAMCAAKINTDALVDDLPDPSDPELMKKLDASLESLEKSLESDQRALDAP